MDILYLGADVPRSVGDGGNCMTYEYLRTLARRHRVHLLAFYESPEELDFVPALKRICSAVEVFRQPMRLRRHGLLYPYMLVRSLLSTQSYKIRKFRNKAFESRVSQLIGERSFAGVHIDHLQMAQFLPANVACKTILHAHNVESDVLGGYVRTTSSLLARLYVAIDRRKLSRSERAAMTGVDMVWVFSERDRALVERLTDGRANVGVVPLCVDQSYWTPRRPADNPAIIFLASMSTPGAVDGAVWFMKHVFPRIKQRIPTTRIYLVGRHPLPIVQRLHNDDDVIVTGFVPDVRPYFERTQVSVVPMLYGGGIKTKTIISMTMGWPVVCTSVGAEGIAVEPGRHLLIEDQPERFADAVVGLLESPDQRQRIGQEGREFALANHGLENVQQAVWRHYDALGLHHPDNS